MKTTDHLLKIVKRQKAGIAASIPSICSANAYVIKAALELGIEKNMPVLIESTANQVNQFGGYTGMQPKDFMAYVKDIAEQMDFPVDRLILGGDHLGPLVWKAEDEAQAMEKAEALITTYVQAGYKKIHIDTSMKLGDDPAGILDHAVIAKRAARLCSAAEQTSIGKDIVYIVGSEVPVPGGVQGSDNELEVTNVRELTRTLDIFETEFAAQGLEDVWVQRVIGIVIQPGVEFGDEDIFEYDVEKAVQLTEYIRTRKNLVYEGHSTDYQTRLALNKMARDGIAIQKVGPALTFALREVLFLLCAIENELAKIHISMQPSGFKDVLDKTMVEKPEYWQKYYSGNEEELAYKRKYSLSDRCRYYLNEGVVEKAMHKLVSNLSVRPIPYTLLSQFIPVQYRKIRENRLDNTPEAVIKDYIKNVILDYYVEESV